MIYAGRIPSSLVIDSTNDVLSPGDDGNIRAKLLVIVEQRALTRGFLTTWIKGLYQDSDVISVTDAETALSPDVLARATLVILGARAGASSEAWFDRQVTWLRAIRADVPLAAIMDSGDLHAVLERARGDGRAPLQGYIPTSSSMDVAAAALQLIAAGGIYTPPSGDKHGLLDLALPIDPARQASLSATCAKLTPRERAVLELLEQGMANKIIAYRLGLSQSTVKAHVHSIISKLNVRNRTEAAMRSYRPATSAPRT